MAKIKKVQSGNYTAVGNQILFDKRISNKGKGLFVLAWALPENWEFNIRGLAAMSSDGYDSVKSGLKELERYGYLVRLNKLEAGRITGKEYRLFEEPFEEQVVDNPPADLPPAEKPDQYNTNPIEDRMIDIYKKNYESDFDEKSTMYNLADACDFRFSKKEMKVIRDIMISIVGIEHLKDVKSYHLLRREFHRLEVRLSNNEMANVKDPFAYFVAMLEKIPPTQSS